MPTNTAFTKTELEILARYGFKGDETRLANARGTITKVGNNMFNIDQRYPKDSGNGYVGHSSPAADFGKLLDIISKFKRYEQNSIIERSRKEAV